MFNRILLAGVIVVALGAAGLGAARTAQAGGYDHHHHHCRGPAPFGPAPYGPSAYSRSAYYRSAYYGFYPAYPVSPYSSYRYRAYYGTPTPYGVYSRGPAFRLSVGF